MGDRCIYCGSQASDADGYYCPQRGFYCNSCVDSQHMRPCSECGQRFPFVEMVERDGDLFCKEDNTRIEAAHKSRDQIKPHPDVVGEDTSIESHDGYKFGSERGRPDGDSGKELDDAIFHSFTKKFKSPGALKGAHF